MPVMRSSVSNVPSVGASAVNEWPAPTGRIGATPAFITATSASSLSGAARAAG